MGTRTALSLELEAWSKLKSPPVSDRSKLLKVYVSSLVSRTVFSVE